MQGVKVQFIQQFGKLLGYFRHPCPSHFFLSAQIQPIKKPAICGLFNMAHPGGFEPPTARFVAEYSIQLSYGCLIQIVMAEREGFEPSMSVNPYALSRGAPSATRPPLPFRLVFCVTG